MSLPNSRSLALKEIIKDLQKNSSTNSEVEKENLLPVSPTDQKEPIENQVVPSTSKRNIPLNERAYNVHQSLRDKGSSYSSDQKSDQDFSPASDDDREYIPPSIADKKEKLEEEHRIHLQEKEKSRVEKLKDKEAVSEKNIVACYDLQAVLQVPKGKGNLKVKITNKIKFSLDNDIQRPL
ncbi:unnamed protein product [Parnassius apollo]|uniref:(apollo) hypothetical protein n=1 Tax=Parnassius apollo TaxID=110799 RepID=A0A8S3Y768_PARAO|nr:unnamed protein product [Parnassius apollo]